jgi:glutamate--cysteine ligase
VVSVLFGDERVGDEALAAVGRLWAGHEPAGEWPPGQPGGNPWPRAARLGPTDPAIAQASRACFEAARSALDRMAAPAPVTAAVDEFIERYVGRNRCPADDLLEESP